MDDECGFGKHFTKEQLDELRARNFNAADQAQTCAQWEALLGDVEASVDEDPASPQAQALLERWDALVAEFTHGDPGVERSLDALYRDPESLAKATAAMPRLPRACSFISRARTARKR